MSYNSGLDVFMREKLDLVKGKRVGLITNQTGLNKDLISNVDLFFQHPEIKLVALYGPEHGVRGNVQAGVKVKDSRDPYTGLPVYSLYGENKKPGPDLLQGIDLLIYDLQDLGLRYYTYISTLLYVLESCGENGLPLLVLDRPNPLGRRVEGNLVQEEFKSFIGLYPLPQRYGLTPGELARWANEEFALGVNLEIVKLEGWQGEYYDELDLPWIPPSPNIPHFQTALVYPVTCLFEGTNISEGRGTANPFEFIGAPWIDPYELLAAVEEKNLPGVSFRPVFFQPSFSKYEGQECGGLHVIINEREEVDSYLTGLTLLQTIFTLYPEKAAWCLPEKATYKYFFDLHMGTDQVRKELEQGSRIRDILAAWEEDRKIFLESRERYLLY